MDKVVNESYFDGAIECPECGQVVNHLYEVETTDGTNTLMCDYCTHEE